MHLEWRGNCAGAVIVEMGEVEWWGLDIGMLVLWNR